MSDSSPQVAVEIIEKKTLYKGFFQAAEYILRHKRHDGTWTDAMSREVFIANRAVAVLPYDPVRDELILIEQFRLGAYVADMPAWQTEIVAGMRDAGEEPTETALREIVEETGCTASLLEPIARYMPSPGCVSESLHVFAACVDVTQAKALCGLAEENEDIKTTVLPAHEVIARLDRGDFQNSITLVSLLWFARHHESLRAKWLSALQAAA